MHGVKIDNTMGVNTWAAFAGSDDNAVVDGDFAVTEDELQPVLKVARETAGSNIVAIHSAHDARTAAHHVFPLLGPRPGQRLGGRNQRRVSGRRLAGSRFSATKTKDILLRRSSGDCRAIVCSMAVQVVWPSGQAPPLRLKQTIPLPGVEGRIDHFAFDRCR